MYRTLTMFLSRPVLILIVPLVAIAAVVPSSAAPGAQQQEEGKALEGARNCYTFLTESTPTGPRVTASPQALQISYGAGDTVYIEGNGAGDLEVGEQMHIVRISGPIRHPGTDATIGQAMSMMGRLQIVDVTGGQALGRITASCRETERGDYLVPIETLEVAEVGDLPPFDSHQAFAPAEGDATVVLGPLESVLKNAEQMTRGGITPHAAVGAGEVVIIDQGQDAGWTAGDFGLIYWTEGTSQYNLAGMSAPPLIAARGLVLWVGQGTANILITNGDGAIELGMRVHRMDSASGS